MKYLAELSGIKKEKEICFSAIRFPEAIISMIMNIVRYQ